MQTKPNPCRAPYAELKAQLKDMGLPDNLIDLVESNTLVERVNEAYAVLRSQNDRLDELEEKMGPNANRLPWYEWRQEWKARGSPLPEWWEVLQIKRIPGGGASPILNLWVWPHYYKQPLNKLRNEVHNKRRGLKIKSELEAGTRVKGQLDGRAKTRATRLSPADVLAAATALRATAKGVR